MIKIADREFKDVYKVKAEHFGLVYDMEIPANSAKEARDIVRYQNEFGVAMRIMSVQGQFFDWPGKEQAHLCRG